MDWNQLVITAEADKNIFNNVQFITLSSYYKDHITNRVMDQLPIINETEEHYFIRVEKKVKEMMDAGKHPVREFIKVTENLDVIMCIDQNMIDDDVVTESVKRLADVELSPNSFYEFGERKSFKSNEAPKYHS